MNFLADLETSIIEEALPVPSSPADANNGEDGEEEADEQEEEEA